MEDVDLRRHRHPPEPPVRQRDAGLAGGAGGRERQGPAASSAGSGSDYRLNGRDVRQHDVRLLFADAATGAHSPAHRRPRPHRRRSLPPSRSSAANCSKKPPALPAWHVRRREAEIRLRAADANLPRLDDVMRGLEAQATRCGGRQSPPNAIANCRIASATVEAALIHARWHAAVAASERRAHGSGGGKHIDGRTHAAGGQPDRRSGDAERGPAGAARGRGGSGRGGAGNPAGPGTGRCRSG